MTKYFFKRILPTPEKIARYKFMLPLLKHMQGSRIWQINRQSISGGLALGVFFAFMPIPLQMAGAAFCAVLLRVNVTAAIVATWLTNPFTITPVMYLCYRVGAALMGAPRLSFDKDEFSLDQLFSMTGEVLIPLFSGTLLLGILSATLTYAVVWFWWLRAVMRFHRLRMRKYSTYRERHILLLKQTSFFKRLWLRMIGGSPYNSEAMPQASDAESPSQPSELNDHTSSEGSSGRSA